MHLSKYLPCLLLFFGPQKWQLRLQGFLVTCSPLISFHALTFWLSISSEVNSSNFALHIFWVSSYHWMFLLRYLWKKVFIAQSCLTLCESVPCSLSGSSVRGILQARMLEWVVLSFSRGSSTPRDQTRVSASPALAGMFFTTRATWEAGGLKCILRELSPLFILLTSFPSWNYCPDLLTGFLPLCFRWNDTQRPLKLR